MGQKKIKKKMILPTNDPKLDDVDEDRQKEIFYDEDTNEVVIIHHYRRQWGDGFDADIDELLNIEENNEFIVVLLSFLERQKQYLSRMKESMEKNLPVVSTIELKETNPMKEYKKEGE
jgi:hypothetical protein